MRAGEWSVVLFDLDGTVANTIPLILESYGHATAQVLGQAASREESLGWIGQTLVDTFTDHYPKHVEPLLSAYLDFNTAHLERLIQRYPGMPELLADLLAAGKTIGIVTSKRREAAQRTLEAVGLAGAIPLLGALEDSREHKPKPEPLLNALAKLGCRPRDAVYIGDASFDLRCADAAGVAGIGVTWGAGTRAQLDAEPHVAVVDSVEDLRALVLG